MLRVIVISMQNGLMSGAIVKYLRERGELIPEQLTDLKREDEPLATCKALSTGVLLMDVSKTPPCSVTITQIRKRPTKMRKS